MMTNAAEVHTHDERDEAIRPHPDDFVSVACHELRNPLSVVVLHAEASARRLEGEVDPSELDRVRESVERIRETARHVARLCESLLDARALETGRRVLQNELVDVATTARTVIDRYRPLCEGARCDVALFAEGTTTAFADPLRLEQVLANLVVNACKHASNSRVEVGVRGDGESICIEVTDHGDGISAEDQRHLGEFFSSLDGTRTRDSVGLGLYICASLVEQMGGQLRCVSTVGEGTSFLVRLPRKAERFEEEDPQLHLAL